MEINIDIDNTRVEVAALKGKIGSSVKSMEMEVDDTTNNTGALSEPAANNKENNIKSQSSHQNGGKASSLNAAKVTSSATKSQSVDSNKSESRNDISLIFKSPADIGTENASTSKTAAENISPVSEKRDSDNENQLQLGEAFKIVQNPETGSSYLIANRDLAPGSIIIEEFAAFYSPHYYRKGATVQFTLDQLCVTCGKVLNPKYNVFPCNECMWPLCSPECAQNSIHLDSECSFLTASNNLFKRGPREDENTSSLFYTNLIGVLRGNNLKKTNPTLFNQLQSVDQANPQDGLPKQQRIQNQQSSDFQNFLSQLKANGLVQTHSTTSANADTDTDDQMETDDTISVENHEYETIFNLLRRNQFCIGQDKFEVHSKSLSLLFPDASLLEHSCLPNCTWSIGSFPKIKDFKIRVRTAVSVKKGETLTISKLILPEQHYQGTAFRQSVLRERDISCNCERCSDPSECGLYTSGLVCPQCKEKDSSSSSGPSTNSKSQSSKPISGYLLPIKIEVNGVSTFKWKCNNSRNNCKYTMDADQVSQILEKADQEIKSVVETIEKEDKEMICIFWDRFQYIDELATRLENLADSLGLHRSHYKFFLKIRETVMMPSAGFGFEEIVSVIPELLEKRMERLKFFMGVEDVVGPGLSMGRAHLLVSLMTVVYAFLLSPSWIKTKKNDGGPEGRRWLDSMYHLFQQTSEQSLEYFTQEFYVPPESGFIKNFHNHVFATKIPVAIRIVNEVKAGVFDTNKLTTN